MSQVDPEFEQVLDDTLENLLEYDYRRDQLSQGLFVMATDLQEYLDHPSWLDSILEEAINEQQPWVVERLHSERLPKGFASSAVDGNIELIEFDDPQIDHEWLMYPGDDLFEVFVRQYYPVICGKRSVQSVSQTTRSEKNVTRDISLLLIGQIGSGDLSLVPFIAVLALHLIEENIDEVCTKYEPY